MPGTFTITCLLNDTTTDSTALQTEHGVSFAIQTQNKLLLFDTGENGKTLFHNAAMLGIDLRQVDALALSHSHYDHTGGLSTVLKTCRPAIPLFSHPDLFHERFSGTINQRRSVGIKLTQSEIARHVTLELSTQPVAIFPGVWTTGEISPRSYFEGRSPNHVIQSDSGWLPDPYRDDLSLVLEGQNGLIIICGCCHAGLLNTMDHVRRIFKRQIAAILGGTHLINTDSATLHYAITQLGVINGGEIPNMYLNHCTGKRPLAALKKAYGDKVQPCPAGTVVHFD